MERSAEMSVVRVKEPRLTQPVLSSLLARAGELVEQGARRLVIDLEAVTYIDSAGIGCLIHVYRLLEARGGSLELSALQPRVAATLSMTGVDRFLVGNAGVPAQDCLR